jgi:hypothetical protein
MFFQASRWASPSRVFKLDSRAKTPFVLALPLTTADTASY